MNKQAKLKYKTKSMPKAVFTIISPYLWAEKRRRKTNPHFFLGRHNTNVDLLPCTFLLLNGNC